MTTTVSATRIFRPLACGGWIALVCCSLLLGLRLPASASIPDAGTNHPFDFGAGGRALALGRAYTAVAEDVSALFWNPAGLSQLQQIELSAMHVQLFYDTPYDFLGAAYPFLDWGTLGVAAVRVASDGIVLRDEFSREFSGSASLDMREYLLGFSRELIANLSAGLTVKVEQQRLAGDFATGVGLDAGLLYALPNVFLFETGAGKPADQLRLGVGVQNAVAPRLRLKGETDTLPLEIKGGVAYRYATQDAWQQVFLITLGVEKSTWRTVKIAAGAEYGLFEVAAVRAGWCEAGWTAGAGVRYLGVLFDYALAGEELGLTHRFSLGYRFGTPLAEQRQAIERQRQKDMDQEAERRARQAVEQARQDMDAALKKMEKQFNVEKKALRNSLQAAANQKLAVQLAAERRRLAEGQSAALANEYFKALHYFQGIKDYLAGDYRRALVEFETVAKYDPKYLELSVYLAKCQQRLKGGTELGVEDMDLYYRGIDLYVEEKFEEAIAVWQQILDRNPNNTLALRNIQEAQDRIVKLRGLEPSPAAPAQP